MERGFTADIGKPLVLLDMCVLDGIPGFEAERGVPAGLWVYDGKEGVGLERGLTEAIGKS